MPDEINRRDLIRIGAGVALAGVSAGPAAFANEDGPRFFTLAELAMLDELTEIVIPADDHSPGARAAKVAAYLDQHVAEAFEAKDRDQWREGLKLVDEISQKMHDHPFMQASPEQRAAVVAGMAKHEMNTKHPEGAFFRQLKQGTARAYYTSKIGIHQEMEYKGNVMLQEFSGYEVK